MYIQSTENNFVPYACSEYLEEHIKAKERDLECPVCLESAGKYFFSSFFFTIFLFSVGRAFLFHSVNSILTPVLTEYTQSGNCLFLAYISS
jgi:hypothetical protein